MRHLTLTLVILLGFTLLQACNPGTTPEKPPVAKTASPVKVNAARDILLHAGDIDTAGYDSLPYWDTSMSHKLSGYIDTFSAAGIHFRFVHKQMMPIGAWEKFDNGQWIIQPFDKDDRYEDYDHTKDLNRDGYNELILYSRSFGSVYFFDPAKKAFSDTVNGDIVRNWWPLDTARNLYYEVYPKATTVCNLFTFKGFDRVDLLRMEFDKGSGDILSNGVLFNPANNQLIKKIHVKEKVDAWSFNYDSCWKQQYRYIPGLK